MDTRDGARVTAVLGPTNTGKTYLAVERMCGHSSGMIGFPLRLLAREVYDRVVKIKGANQVALITGEEKIVPPGARWFLCTAESMPVDRDVAFVGIDEAQLGADPERGHVFTDRLLRARGREETMILGSEALRPVLKHLVPEAEIIGRPRFSTLSYAGATKLSRLPRRSAIVAFSAEEVYAVAEMLRRLRGGAAVVMGALSPRTRNAQVAMFQAGEVDYLVATDAIGMGLNMDVAHVAFAGLHKFDGHRRRRLMVSEMAQIAGRAGRHQRDGTFGGLTGEGPDAFTPEEVYAVEEHRFPRLDHLYWRDGDPDYSSIDALINSLETRPNDPVLRAAPEAIDLAVLKRLGDEDWVRDGIKSPFLVARLWAACGLPDFRKLGLDPHARFVARLFAHLCKGPIPHTLFAEEIARLDRIEGDVETLAGRIAAIRTWAYIAQRPDWLADPVLWADRTRAIEEKLSDALHASLTQRFVDKRTTALMRQIGNDPLAMPVVVGAEGEVLVENHPIGRLEGFRFTVDPDARSGDKRLLLAAAERRLGVELARRGASLIEAADADFALSTLDTVFRARPQPVEPKATEGQPPSFSSSAAQKKDGSSTSPRQTGRGEGAGTPAITWQGHPVATLKPGPSLARPRIIPDRALDTLDRPQRAAIQARLEAWLASALARHLPLFPALEALTRDAAATPSLRAAAAAILDAGGLAPRRSVEALVSALDPAARKRLRALGVTIGALDIFDARLIKPEPARWRRALLAARGMPVGAGPVSPASVLPRDAPGATLTHGFRPLGPQAVRIDLVERIAKIAFDARQGRKPFAPDSALATSIGLAPETLARLMAQLGFRSVAPIEGRARWMWHGVPPRAPEVAPVPGNAFAALAGLRHG